MVVSEGVGCGTSAFELKKEISLWFVLGEGGGAVRKRNRSCNIVLISKC